MELLVSINVSNVYMYIRWGAYFELYNQEYRMSYMHQLAWVSKYMRLNIVN